MTNSLLVQVMGLAESSLAGGLAAMAELREAIKYISPELLPVVCDISSGALTRRLHTLTRPHNRYVDGHHDGHKVKAPIPQAIWQCTIGFFGIIS